MSLRVPEIPDHDLIRPIGRGAGPRSVALGLPRRRRRERRKPDATESARLHIVGSARSEERV